MSENIQLSPAPEASVLTVVPAKTEARVFEAEATKLADSAILTNAEATTAVRTEDDLCAEITRLWTANKVNRYELGEKLCQLKQQAKHGEWMKRVEATIGIPQRTVNSLMSYYREEFQQRTAKSVLDVAFDAELADPANSDQEDEPQGERNKAPYFRPKISLKWEEQTAWKSAIEVIIAQVDHVNNPTEAVFYAVTMAAERFAAVEPTEPAVEAVTVDPPAVPVPLLLAGAPEYARPYDEFEEVQ
jgi:hypothetical protein